MGRAITSYSRYLEGIGGLIGVPTSRISTELAASLLQMFMGAMRKIWSLNTWIDICPYGEARFVGNRLTYPNDTAQTGSWTNTALTITRNSVQNPADGLTTASKMMETAANSAHKIVQNVTTFYPSTDYSASFYIRPNGRNDVQMSVYDGVTTHSAFFSMASGGSVGTTSNTNSTSITLQPNGFFLCNLTFTADAAATTSGTFSVLLSTNGSTVSYAGDTSKGIYIWGNLVQQTENTPVNDSILPWDQTGENTIDALIAVYGTSPASVRNPVTLTTNLLPTGIQLINATPWQTYYIQGVAQSSTYGAPQSNPVYIFYRKQMPNWSGDVFDATATYALNDQVFYTLTAAPYTGDYWRCVVATTAGQDPEDTPTSWEKLEIPEIFLPYLIHQAFAEWLVSDGQMTQAGGAYQIAANALDDAAEVQERQMGLIMPLRVQSHLTAANWGP